MNILRRILRWFGYYKIDYGFACGRHWMSIDGKVIAQTGGDDVWMRDEDVEALVKFTIGAPEWPLKDMARDARGNDLITPKVDAAIALAKAGTCPGCGRQLTSVDTPGRGMCIVCEVANDVNRRIDDLVFKDQNVHHPV